MKLTLFFDHRFLRAPDGIIFSPASYNYDLLASRYLSVFGELTVVARTMDSATIERGAKRVEGDGVTVVSVGNWLGPGQYFRVRQHVKRVVEHELNRTDAVLMIAPGTIGQVAARQLRTRIQPYGVEVVGDPRDVFAAGAARHPLRPLLRAWAVRELRQQVAGASAVAYVSKLNLPERYPAKDGAFITNYSSIELMEDHFCARARTAPKLHDELRLVTIGTLSQMYKGVDLLIDATSVLAKQGMNVTLTVLGDGRYRRDLERMVESQGLSGRVRFLGHLPAGDEVRACLDEADMFVMASRTEGLPRAMIEAMARGLPCVGTNVGGIPELLPKSNLVPVGDPIALAGTIMELASNPKRFERQALRNVAKAREYRADILQSRRVEMYTHVKQETLAWKRGDRA